MHWSPSCGRVGRGVGEQWLGPAWTQTGWGSLLPSPLLASRPQATYLTSLSLKSSFVKWKKLWCHPSRILSSLSELKACEMLSITRGA